MYKVIRFYFNRPRYRRTIKDHITLQQAQEHCNDPETSSSTCKGNKAKAVTRKRGAWFDGYEEM